MTDRPAALVSVPDRGPGHCDDDAAWATFVRQYDGKPRSRPDLSDFALANAVYMADRNDLDLIVWQTAAKERIRWLSIELAKALAAAPAAPQAAGVGEDDGARLLWNRFAVAHHESWDDEPNKAEYRQAAADVLALRAPSPEPEGGAVLFEALPDEIDLFRIMRAAGRSNAEKAKAVAAHLLALATREEAPELALEDAKAFGVGFIVDGQRVSPDRVTVCRGEEAPAGAGERTDAVVRVSAVAAGAQVEQVYGGEWCADPATGFRADLIKVLAIRAQPQAREEAQPVRGADLAKAMWGVDLIPATPPAPEAEKLRMAVEALEKASRAISAQYALAQAEYQHLDTVASKHDKIVQEGRRAIREALAALQQEGK